MWRSSGYATFFALCINDNDPGQRVIGIEAGHTLLGMCDELWQFGTHISEGMQREIDFARRKLKIPVLVISEDYVESFLSNRIGGG